MRFLTPSRSSGLASRSHTAIRWSAVCHCFAASALCTISSFSSARAQPSMSLLTSGVSVRSDSSGRPRRRITAPWIVRPRSFVVPAAARACTAVAWASAWAKKPSSIVTHARSACAVSAGGSALNSFA